MARLNESSMKIRMNLDLKDAKWFIGIFFSLILETHNLLIKMLKDV